MEKKTIQIIEATAVDAPAHQVWDVLADFSGYSSWNPFIRAAKGNLEKGRKIFLFLNIPGGLKMILFPRILEVRKGEGFRWLGSFLIPGLFDGEHEFKITAFGADNSRFMQKEKFSGVLVPLFGKFISEGARKGFRAMNTALCEKLSDRNRLKQPNKK